MRQSRQTKYPGVFLHAKHAYMPNNLGYCGPDERGMILEHLHDSKVDEELLGMLKRFEAAYPFLKMIAKSTGREPFDYRVAEAYWIGNSLLDHVQTKDFFEFAHQGLGKIRKDEAKLLFSKSGALARPHHTFYVLGMYTRNQGELVGDGKLLQLMDSCRISWGKVASLDGKRMIVEYTPLRVKDGLLELSTPVRKQVSYDSQIPSFSKVREGDWVSLHWDFACERLTQRQLQNLRNYTLADIKGTNSFVKTLRRQEQIGRRI